MSFGAIQFGGLASGLDTGAIIEALLNVEKVPINQLQSQKSAEQKKLSLLGTFEGLVNALKDKAKDLSTVAGFNSYTVTPSVENAVAIDVTGAPVKGAHTIQVNALATADSWAYAGVADDDADLGAGQLVLQYGAQSFTVDVTDTGSSLNEIAAAISDQTGGAVSATVVNVGASGTPSYRLVLSGQDTGAANQLTLSQTGIAGLSGATELSNAVNASLTIDGLTVERSTNEFSDVVEGLSITALSTNAGAAFGFTVEVDSEGIKTKLNEFVDAYNAVIEFVNTQNTYDPDKGAPELFGDNVLRAVRQELTSALFGVDISTVLADTEGYSTLGLVGIDVKANGTLEIDEELLDEKLEANPKLLADLFVDTDGFDNGGVASSDPGYYTDTSADSGVFEKMWRGIDKLMDSKTAPSGKVLKGLFAARKETINTIIERMDDQIDALEIKVEQLEEMLIAKFAALEEVMAGLTAQQTALLSQIQSLPGPSNE